MKLRKSVGLILSSILSVGILAACSSQDPGSSTSGETTPTNAEPADGSKVIKVATHTPLSGNNAIIGEAMKLGAQMKLEEEISKFEEMGYTIQLESYDDQSDPKKGVSNANLIGADESIYGVIGHFNSGVTIPSSEIYEKYNIPMVIPGATATEITERGLKTANRVVARDDFQGPAGAQYAVNELGAKKIFVIQDKTAYGSGLADAFIMEAEKLGAEIVGFEGITVGEKDFNGVINQVLNKQPDLIFFGGVFGEGGIIIKQARDKGITVPIMGGDGMDSSGLVDIAGDAIKDVYITAVAGDATATPEGQKFTADYQSKFNKAPEAFSVYGYDSMGVFLAALESAINANNGELPPKEAVVEAVRATQGYKGVLTEVSFDEKGDNKNAKIYFFKFEEAKYPGIYVGEVSQ